MSIDPAKLRTFAEHHAARIDEALGSFAIQFGADLANDVRELICSCAAVTQVVRYSHVVPTFCRMSPEAAKEFCQISDKALEQLVMLTLRMMFTAHGIRSQERRLEITKFAMQYVKDILQSNERPVERK
jgi:hypothetical protein